MEQQGADRPEIDWGRLCSPVPKESFQVRPGARSKDGAQALIIAYIDADYVAETLDTVVGPSNWRTECQEITDAGVIAVRRSIAIRVGDEWIEKWDYGYPNTIVDGQMKDEEPLKSAASDDRTRREVFDFIEVLYNRQRLHASLGYLSPADFERQSVAEAA